jgi:excisionase family DNA binding protein
MQHQRRFYTIPETARILNFSRTTAYALIAAGELVVTRMGPRTVRVSDEDLENFIRTRAKSASRDPVRKRSAASQPSA